MKWIGDDEVKTNDDKVLDENRAENELKINEDID